MASKKLIARHKDLLVDQEFDRVYQFLEKLVKFNVFDFNATFNSTNIFTLINNGRIVFGYVVVTEAFGGTSELKIGSGVNLAKYMVFDISTVGFRLPTMTTETLQKISNTERIIASIGGTPIAGKGHCVIIYTEE